MDNLKARLKVKGVEFSTFPIFGEDVKLQLTRESDQIFRREKLDGTFRFVNKDFDLIANCSANTEFTLEFYRENEFVGKGTFYKTDCRMDYDNKICEVALTTTDKYEKIMNGLNNTFNLIRLAPVTERAVLTRRAVLQFYVKGEDVLTNIFGGVHFEQDCQEVNDENILRNTYLFGTKLPLSSVMIPDGVPTAGRGRYVVSSVGDDNRITYRNSNGWTINAYGYLAETYRYRFDILTDRGVFVCVAVLLESDFLKIGKHALKFRADLLPQSEIITTGTYYNQGDLYARILSPTTAEGAPRPMEDIVEYNSNYPAVVPMVAGVFSDYIQLVEEKSTTPTEWGIDSEQKYFTAPVLTDTQKTEGISPIPFGYSHWEALSTWLMVDRNLSTRIDSFNQTFELKDAYSVANCIKVLLNEIDPSISFAEDEAHSIFLSSREPDTAELIDAYPFPRSREARIFLTPITNVKKTRYEQAAQRGDITLKQIFDMLRNVYRCYWWIDSENRLRIEHITYLKNGMMYLDSFIRPQVDLTKMLSLPTAKKWGFNTNTVQGDKSRCPARYEFGWGDAQTEQFNGYAIDIKDKYIDQSKTEKLTIENIVTDLDYVIINPNGVNDDLFALFEAYDTNKRVALAYVRLSNTSPMYRLQNGYCSFLFAETSYYPYDLSGWQAKANGEDLSVIGTKAFKSQSLSFPVTLEQARSVEFIQSDMGIGEMDSIEIDADTLHANAKIYYSEGKDLIDSVTIHTVFEEGELVYYAKNNSDAPVEANLVWNRLVAEIFSIELQPFEDKLIGREPCRLLSVQDASFVEVGKPNITYDSQMEFRMVYGSDAQGAYCQIDFDGHQEEQGRYEHTWGLCSILAKKDLQITCVATTEDNYDIAWANDTPCITRDEALNAQYSASGEGSFSFILSKGESICIGYTKDRGAIEYSDRTRFTIKEIKSL